MTGREWWLANKQRLRDLASEPPRHGPKPNIEAPPIPPVDKEQLLKLACAVEDGWIADELILAYTETPTASARHLQEHSEVTLDERTRVLEAKRPNCPRCESTIEQLGLQRSEAPVDVFFCPNCGCVLGVVPKGSIPTTG